MTTSIYLRTHLPSPIKITSFLDQHIEGIDFIDSCHSTTNAVALTPLHSETHQQLDEYFSGKRLCFSLPYKFSGTKFQEQCWTSLLKIPYGITWSYAEQAANIGNSKACRAVGNANRKNPLPIIIPCHRIIGKDGSLTGFGGGLQWKQFLLDGEQQG